jgi:signal transduction histidine kinase
MKISIIIAVIILTVIIATIYIVAINFIHAKNRALDLKFRNIAIQLLAMTVWTTVLSNIFFPRSLLFLEDHTMGMAVFAMSLVVGIFLIRSMFRELETESDVEKLINRLHKNNILLKKVDIQKTEFVSLASHQLRGPLTNIYGYTSMMLEGDYGDIPPHLQEPLNRIFKSSTFLGFLINDFLNVSRIEKGEMEYTMQDFDIIATLNQLMKEFQLVAKNASLDFIKEFKENDVAIVRGDINKTKQILSNLIDNSIKYTPKGYVAISCTLNAKNIVVKVRDSGIGLGTNMKENLFKKFMRDKDATKINVSGSGLGLYVASVMAKGMDGKLWAESAGQGKGTTFFVELPLATK